MTAGSIPPHSSLGRHWLRASVVLTALFLLLFRFSHPADASARLDAFPARGEAWSSRPLDQALTEQSILGEARLMKRLCQTISQQVTLFVIDSTLNRHAAHDPAYCLRGAGWKVTGEEKLTVPGGSAVRLTITRDGQTTEAVYWFSDGKNRHGSPVWHWLQSALRQISPGSTSPAPILMLLVPKEGSPANWPQLWQEMPELWNL